MTLTSKASSLLAALSALSEAHQVVCSSLQSDLTKIYQQNTFTQAMRDEFKLPLGPHLKSKLADI